MREHSQESLFFQLTQPFLDSDVERGTMMGYPCLRLKGAFFASEERESGHLIVKLHADRVHALVADGTGLPFAPSGKVFREWLLVAQHDEAVWVSLLKEALVFAQSGA